MPRFRIHGDNLQNTPIFRLVEDCELPTLQVTFDGEYWEDVLYMDEGGINSCCILDTTVQKLESAGFAMAGNRMRLAGASW